MATECKAKKSGYAWHAYHCFLLSYISDYDWRVADIERHKPAAEIPERLKRFQFVKGKLPDAFQGTYDNSHVTRLIDEHYGEVMRLHVKECPNCTWNGRELVFGKPSWLQRIRTRLRLRLKVWLHE